jgi:ketosteroid isomerase-like protein
MTATITATTKAVLDRHMRALLGGDVDGILADYADDATLISAQRIIRGHDGLRAMFSNIPPGSFEGFAVTKEVCDGEVALIEWTSKHVGFGTDTFVVRDGKIVAQTVAHK